MIYDYIPKYAEQFPAGGVPQYTPREDRELRYHTPHGDIIVSMWCRYPSYDFIFGVPAEDHSKHSTEVVYFVYRDARIGPHHSTGLYLDRSEAQDMVDGFTAALIQSKKTHPLWKTKEENTPIPTQGTMNL